MEKKVDGAVIGGGDSGVVYMAAERSFPPAVSNYVGLSRYTRCELMRLRYKCNRLDPSIILKVKDLGLFRNRGRRAGKKMRRNIMTQVTKREEKNKAHVSHVHAQVLTVPPIVRNVNKNKTCAPPILLLTNPQSLTNVYEEFYGSVVLHNPDIIGVSETWFSLNKPAKLYALPGYELLHKDRETRGGGVALYVKEEFAIRDLNICVPNNLECVWVMIEQNFSRLIKRLCVCCIYYPPDAPTHDELLDHLITTTDALRSMYSDMRVVILGDCNRLDVGHLMTQSRLRCIVTEPTHENSTIDLILTDAEFYTSSETHPPIGLSRHRCVLSRPDALPAPPSYSVRSFRPFLDSSVRRFGQWITSEDWRDILATDDADEAADTLERMLVEQYESSFPERRQRMRKENKPWITAKILRLMDARRQAYTRGRMDQWKTLYYQVKQEIKIAKRQTALKIEQNDINSAQFAKDIKSILGAQKKKLNIPFLDHLSAQEISEKIKTHFTNICTHFPPINVLELPSFFTI